MSGYTSISPHSCEQGLLGFVFPLGLVYFAEYFINQGLVSSLVPSGITFILLHVVMPNPTSWRYEMYLEATETFPYISSVVIILSPEQCRCFLFQMELLYFPDFFLSHAEQYRWSVNLTAVLF